MICPLFFPWDTLRFPEAGAFNIMSMPLHDKHILHWQTYPSQNTVWTPPKPTAARYALEW